MAAELVSWVFASPRRLVVTAGSLVLLVITGVASLSGNDMQAAGAGRPTTAPSQAASAPDPQPFVDAAVRFAAEWARPRPGEAAPTWHARVSKQVTPELSAALRLTDPRTLPGAAPSGAPTVRYVSRESALIAVPLSDGSSVAVTVVSLGRRLQVSDVQPDVGDLGDVGLDAGR